MLKVNEEKFLSDYKDLVAKREENLAEIERQATLYAVERGYDEERTKKFVAFTKELEGDGLSAEDKAKLEILETYIEEAIEVTADLDGEETETDAEAAHAEEAVHTFVI